jgi:hypothetical protein
VGLTLSRANVPNYRKLISEHKDASSPYRKDFIESYSGGEDSSCLIKVTDSSVYPPLVSYQTAWSRSRIDAPAGFVPSPPITDGESDDRAIRRLYSALKSANPDFDLLPFAGEFGELRGLVRSLAGHTTSLVKSLIDIKHGRMPKLLQRSKAADLWLSYNFGISPILNDAQSLAEAIASYVYGTGITLRFTGSHKRNWSSDTTSVIAGSQGLTYKVKILTDFSYSVRYTAGHRFVASGGTSGSFASHFGLRPADILPAIWELAPYSWVVDYFTNVGDVLDQRFSSRSGNTIFVLSQFYPPRRRSHP